VNEQSASHLRAQAAWCLKLVNSISDKRTRDILQQSAEEFENEARRHDLSEAKGNGVVGPRNE
jgi:hypothetical protein